MHKHPRESLRVLPEFLQPFFTYVTGVPYDGQRPLFRSTPWTRLISASSVTCLGVALGIIALDRAWFAEGGVPRADILWALPMLIASWTLVTGGTRDLYVVVEHACTHLSFSRRWWVNRLVGDVIATLLWVTSFDKFRKDHMIHHGATRTAADPDVIFLRRTAEFETGMSSRELRRYLLRTILSTRFHLKYFWQERLMPNFSGPAARSGLSVVYAVGLAATLTVTETWVTWMIVWAFPLIILFQASSLINFISEHRWLRDIGQGRLGYGRLNFGRFCGDPVPDTRRIAGWALYTAWVTWWLRLLFVHLPSRVAIMVGDLPQHDAHHRHPGYDWSNAAYVRRFDQLAGCPGWPEPYTEVWGTVLDFLDESIRQTYRVPTPREDRFAFPFSHLKPA